MKVNSPKFDFIRADKSNEIKSINQSINAESIKINCDSAAVCEKKLHFTRAGAFEFRVARQRHLSGGGRTNQNSTHSNEFDRAENQY